MFRLGIKGKNMFIFHSGKVELLRIVLAISLLFRRFASILFLHV
jgi:hypothetical protein